MSNQANVKSSQVFEKSAVIHLEFRQWSGSVVFDRADFKGEVPPDEVTATRGQKRLVDPKCLREFANIKDRAVSVLNDFGVPFLKGYLVSLDQLADVTRELDKLRNEYNSKRDQFVADLPKHLEDWASANDRFADNLRQRSPSGEDVASRIHADYTVTRVAPVPGHEELLDSAGLAGELVRDVQSRARKLLDSALERGEASQRAKSAISKILSKVSSLAYLDVKFSHLVNHFRSLLLRLPTQGAITDNAFLLFTTAMNMVVSKELLHGVLDGSNTLEMTMQRITKPQSVCGAASASVESAKPVVESIPSQNPVKSETNAPAHEMLEQAEFDFSDLDRELDALFEQAPAEPAQNGHTDSDKQTSAAAVVKTESEAPKEPRLESHVPANDATESDNDSDWEMYGEVPPPPPSF